MTDARPVGVNLRGGWAAGEAEPWYLATTLKTEKEVRRFYGQRMRIEQAFRDGKSHFQVGAMERWENQEHGERMLAVLTVVLLFVGWLAWRRLPVGGVELREFGVGLHRCAMESTACTPIHLQLATCQGEFSFVVQNYPLR